MKKHFITADTLLLDAFRLGVKIYESGFRPTFIVGLWRGGSEVGIYVQECLQTLGVKTDHIALRTSYRGQPHYQTMVDSPDTEIRVHGTQYLMENLNVQDKLLIVDDVFSTGLSTQAVINRLRTHTKRNMPADVRVATPWYRPSYNKTEYTPDYYLHSTEDWLVFPYELSGLSMDEIRQHKPFLIPLMDEVRIHEDDA